MLLSYFQQFLVLTVLLIWASACSDIAKKEPIKVQTNSLKISEAYLTVDNQRVSNGEVLYGKVLFLFVKGIEGFQYKGEKAYLGCSMTVKDSLGNVLSQADDIFAMYDKDGIPPASAQGFSIHIETGSPLRPNQSYVWEARFWDKVGGGDIKTEVNFKVTGGELVKVVTQKNGLEVENVFLSDTQRKLEYNEVEFGSTIGFHLMGISGFEIKADSTVNVNAEMKVADEEGNIVIQYNDLYAQVKGNPKARDASTMNLNLLLGQPLQIGKRYQWQIKLFDQNNQKNLITTITFKVVQNVKMNNPPQ